MGMRWREFCGFRIEEAQRIVEKSLVELGFEYTKKQVNPSSIDTIIFGSDEKVTEYELRDSIARIRLVKVTGDPLLRLLSKIAGRSILVDEACIIDVSLCDEDFLRKLLAKIVENSDRKPWVLNHPRFRISWLLRYRVKRNWMKYLSGKNF